MTPHDLSALTPLIFHHVNPYGAFELDMEARIPIETEVARRSGNLCVCLTFRVSDKLSPALALAAVAGIGAVALFVSRSAWS